MDFEQTFDSFTTYAMNCDFDFDVDYYNTHKKRLCELYKMIPIAKENKFAIEIGATGFFQPLLKIYYGYQRVMGTIWSFNIEEKIYKKTYNFLNKVDNEIISVDLERELFPLESNCVDFILCSEVIEHLDIDPMFMLSEFNRIMKRGGKILLTSPNSCSARNFYKIAHGFRPHFFMQYIKTRSPNRHNIEYDIRALRILLESAGFQITSYLTKDVFESPSCEGITLLKKMALPLRDRGDCIFIIANKVSDVRDRWPGEIYA